MPVTLTVSGHEELITSLHNLSDKLQGPEVVDRLAQETSAIMSQNAPVGIRGATRGQLRRTLSEKDGPTPTAEGWWAGVGNLAGIYPLEPAPRHTIRNFLDMIRGRVGGETRRRKKKPRKRSFDPKKAWWFLSDEEKSQLRQLRESGVAAVGGVSPYRPKYWFIQEEGMREVGISRQRYVQATVNAIRGRINSIVNEVLSV